MITEMFLKRRPKKAINKGSCEYYLEYKSETIDETGLGGTWSGTGVYADLHRVMGYWVGTAPFKMNKPIFVFKEMEEVFNFLEEEYGVLVKKMYD